MKNSFSYYLVLFVLKLKGLKTIFSQDPINYKKLRKDDIHFPKNRYFKNKKSVFNVLQTSISEIKNVNPSDKLLLFIHGGAFVSGPSEHHWNSIEFLSKNSSFTIWMCNYPKAPENKIDIISDNIDAVFESALKKYSPENIVIIGDSAGGTLSISLVQRLIKNNKKTPSKLILISPVIDATLKNKEIELIDKKDPMLSKNGVLSAKKMCSENLENPLISPINETTNGFPPTFLFLAENDITYPDQLLFLEKLNHSQVNTSSYIGENLPHIWPYLPLMKEAKKSLKQITKILNSN